MTGFEGARVVIRNEAGAVVDVVSVHGQGPAELATIALQVWHEAGLGPTRGEVTGAHAETSHEKLTVPVSPRASSDETVVMPALPSRRVDDDWVDLGR